MTLRRAQAMDAPAITELYLHTRRTCLPYLPPITDEPDAHRFFAGVVKSAEVWVSEGEGRLAAFIAFTPDWVEHLYVHPEHHGRGLGDALLSKAKAGSGDLRLWTFQKNAQARRFYEARGFVAKRETDGAENMEREPDVLYRWRG
ncbi:MAG: GNAT family N-acetyltransferase [Caulobacteraceae bacterium]|nr:GNAT family N-acetyltransferase [Caulobacteraceae bacterium]